ncbi:hypothetical protein [Microtetraspora niveoalba]|uniref:hypothetical protein n=1 Tax=Microtetraspora niveoalba TaxID=46175 RepID=UPI0008361635|nr:hypothetical protein [Microtetraspora niveoalba]
MTGAAATAEAPYITAFAGELVNHPLVFRYGSEARAIRLSYVVPDDSDWQCGVLLARHGRIQTGLPCRGRVHTRRQWRCMEHGLCLHCGEPAVDASSGRFWWVIYDGPGTDLDRGYTSTPPTCRACIPAQLVRRPCIGSSRPWIGTAVLAKPYAVLADIYRQGVGGALLDKQGVTIPLDEFRRLEQALAHRLIVSFTDLRAERWPS